jgi:hypothetical protein
MKAIKVHVAARLDGGDFDPADGFDAARPLHRLHHVDCGGRVVVGDGHCRHACRRGAIDARSAKRPSDAVV